jgi:hypothetical protein
MDYNYPQPQSSGSSGIIMIVFLCLCISCMVTIGVTIWYFTKKPENKCLAKWAYYKGGVKKGDYEECADPNGSGEPWCPIAGAYILGTGKKGINMQYFDNEDDPEAEKVCQKDWRLYDDNGKEIGGPYPLLKKRDNEARWWCPLKAYVSGGKEGVTWKRC